LVLDDGPKMGTWDVSTTGVVPGCQNDAARESWTTTYLGPPPLDFIDASAASDRDPYFLFSFDSDSPNAVRFRPTGDVTFDVGDSGDSATLTWVSAENEADFDDGSPSVTTGPAELTVECGAVYRYE
jgi:hypothetical protein